MKFEKIENDLTNLLLRDIVIYINPAKPLKQGKLKLFKIIIPDYKYERQNMGIC